MPAILRSAGRHVADSTISRFLGTSLRLASWCNTNDSISACGCSECSRHVRQMSCSNATGGNAPHCTCNICSLETSQGCISNGSCQCPRCSSFSSFISGQPWTAVIHAIPRAMTQHGASSGSRSMHSARSTVLDTRDMGQCCILCQRASCVCTILKRTFSTVEQHQNEVSNLPVLHHG